MKRNWMRNVAGVLVMAMTISGLVQPQNMLQAKKKAKKSKKISCNLSVSTTAPTGGNVKITVKPQKGCKIKSLLWKKGKSTKSAMKYWKKAKNIKKNKSFTASSNGWYSVRLQDKKNRVVRKTILIGNIDKKGPDVAANYTVTDKVATMTVSASDPRGISFVGYTKGSVVTKNLAAYTPLAAPYQFTADTPGYYTICARDGVGNFTYVERYVTLWTDLTSLPIFDSEWGKVCEGTFLDRWERMYTNPLGICPTEEGKKFVEYYLNGGYKKLSGTIVRGKGIKDEIVVWLQILADDVVIYESPKMDYKSQPIDFDIEVNNAKYLKIRAISNKDDMWGYDYDDSYDCEGLYITNGQLYN